MKPGNFLRKSLVLLTACLLTGWTVVHLVEDDRTTIAVFLGITIAYVNALFGFILINWGFRRSDKDFMISVFGGMILRFLLIFACLIVLIWGFKIAAASLAFSIMMTYFLFLGLEILHIHATVKLKGTTE